MPNNCIMAGKCPYFTYSTRIEGEGRVGGILFVGDCPGRNEDALRKVIAGQASQKLSEAMQYANLARDNVRIENIVQCAPRDYLHGPVGFPSEEAERLCSFNLFESLKTLKPKLIIPLGDKALKAFGLGCGSISKDRGRLYKFEFDGQTYLVFPTYSPVQVIRTAFSYPDISNQFFTDIWHASHIVNRPDALLDYSYTMLDTVDKALDFAEFLHTYDGWVGVDVETEGLAFFDFSKNLLTVAFTLESGKSFCLPFLHPESPFFNDDYAIAQIIKAYSAVLSKVRLVGQNFLFDACWLYARLGALCERLVWDTMWAAHHYFSGVAYTNLEYISAYFGKIPNWKSMVDSKELVNTPLKEVCDYNVMDAVNTLYVAKMQKNVLITANLYESYVYLYIRSYPAFLQWRVHGICIDEDVRVGIKNNFTSEVDRLLEPVFKSVAFGKYTEIMLAGLREFFDSKSEVYRKRKWHDDFDTFKQEAWGERAVPHLGLKSSVDMNRFLIDCVGLPIVSQGKKGAKFDKSAFQKYLCMYADGSLKNKNGVSLCNKEVGEIMFSIRDARHLEYMLSGFVVNLPNHYHGMVEQADGTYAYSLYERKMWHNLLPQPMPFFVHPDFDASGTVTGRVSVKDPPMHGFPDEDNSPIKRIVVSRFRDEGGMIMSYDTAQTEYRVIACLANDEVMLNIYRSGVGDLHLFVSSRFCGVPEAEVHKSIRRLFKRVSFSCVFGGGEENMVSTVLDIMNVAEQIKSESVQRFLERMKLARGDVGKIAEEFRKEFFGLFKGISRYHAESEKLAASSDVVWSKTGRWRPVPSYAFKGKSKVNRFVNNRVQTCISGDTKISLLNGTEVAIQDLVGVPEFWVYSCTPDGRIVPGRGHSARKTKTVNELCVVTIDNGKSERCTPDHPWMMRDGTYKQAKDLVTGDSLMPLYRRVGGDGYEEVLHNSSQEEWQLTHQNVVWNVLGGYKGRQFCHHFNFDKRNNDPSNLELVSWTEHGKRHGLLSRARWDSMSDIERKNAVERLRDSVLAYWKDDDRYDDLCQKNRVKAVAAHADEYTRSKILAGLKKGLQNSHVPVVCRYCGRTLFGTFALKMHMDFVHEGRKFQGGNCDICGKYCKSLTGLKIHLRRHEGSLLRSSAVYECPGCGLTTRSPGALGGHKKICKVLKNHKVLSVQKIDYDSFVYDISVDCFENFALSSGVFVHNCASDIITPTIAVNTHFQYEELGLRSKVLLTKHDATYVDLHPSEFVVATQTALDTVAAPKTYETTYFKDEELAAVLKEYFKKWPFDWLKIPLIADPKIGISEGDPCSLEVKGPGHYKVSGKPDRFSLLMQQLIIAKDHGHLDFDIIGKDVKSKDGDESVVCEFNLWNKQ